MKLGNVLCATASTAAAALVMAATPAYAIDGKEKRYRVGLGAQVKPTYPGADKLSVLPLINVDWQDEGELFEFEAPDESAGISVLGDSPIGFGPAISFEGPRKAKDVGAPLDKVGFTVEAGAFLQYEISPSFRLRGEARKGLGGHEGWIGNLSADYVAREGDDWLFSIGPRLTIADGKYHRAYFGVTPTEAAATGLPAFRPGGGILSYGAAAGAQVQLSERWGLFGYAKYDRLTRDAADSPVVREFGSRDQLSGGIGLSYSWGARIDD